jgi:DNA-binding transcriptional LysR family regulator
MDIYVAHGHPLAQQGSVSEEQLRTWRELRLNTYLENRNMPARGPVWSAPSYLLLLSMAEQGFGWCALPCALVDEFSGAKKLTRVDVPGWPQSILIDLLWNKKQPPGVAGSWLRHYLQHWRGKQ